MELNRSIKLIARLSLQLHPKAVIGIVDIVQPIDCTRSQFLTSWRALTIVSDDVRVEARLEKETYNSELR